MKCIGSKTITWLALALSMGGCVVLSNAAKAESPDPLQLGSTWEWLEKPIEGVIFYYDDAISGYLLICIAAAFLSTASFQEVMSGTEDKLIRTKFKDAAGLMLFSQAAFIIQALITIAFICGPIIGGFLNDMHGMQEACLTMAFFGAGYLVFYSLGGIFVHCTRY